MKKETAPAKPITEIALSFPNMTDKERKLLGEYWALGKQLSLGSSPVATVERYNAIKAQALDIVKRNPGRTELPKA